jgi:hypothetical protein
MKNEAKKSISQQALRQPESTPESGARCVAAKKQLDQQEVSGKFHNGRSLPQAEAVTVLPVEGEKGVSAKHAALQNSSLTSDGKRIQNQPPAGAKFPTVVSSGN